MYHEHEYKEVVQDLIEQNIDLKIKADEAYDIER